MLDTREGEEEEQEEDDSRGKLWRVVNQGKDKQKRVKQKYYRRGEKGRQRDQRYTEQKDSNEAAQLGKEMRWDLEKIWVYERKENGTSQKREGEGSEKKVGRQKQWVENNKGRLGARDEEEEHLGQVVDGEGEEKNRGAVEKQFSQTNQQASCLQTRLHEQQPETGQHVCYGLNALIHWESRHIQRHLYLT